MLRERGVVGMFVEFYGAGLAALPIADRATIGNMSPEFGSTCAIFPIDAETLALPASSPAAPSRADRAGRGLRAASRACGTTSTPSSRPSRTRSSSTSATSNRASPARSARRTGSPLSEAQRGLPRARWPDYVPGDAAPGGRRRRGRRGDLSRLGPAGQRRSPVTAHRRRPAAARHAARAGATATAERGTPGRRRRSAVAGDARTGESFELDHGARRDRRDHQLHEHLEPVGDGRRGHPRAQRASPGACAPSRG